MFGTGVSIIIELDGLLCVLTYTCRGYSRLDAEEQNIKQTHTHTHAHAKRRE